MNSQIISRFLRLVKIFYCSGKNDDQLMEFMMVAKSVHAIEVLICSIDFISQLTIFVFFHFFPRHETFFTLVLDAHHVKVADSEIELNWVKHENLTEILVCWSRIVTFPTFCSSKSKFSALVISMCEPFTVRCCWNVMIEMMKMNFCFTNIFFQFFNSPKTF